MPNVTGLQVYNDTATGIPLSVMECGYLTGLRTAAVSAIIARECALPEARTLALAGCGFEGTMHLWFLVSQIPGLKEIRLRDIRSVAMQSLKEHASKYFSGEIRICEDNRTCFEGADIISTCTNGDEQLVQPEWFKPGAGAGGIEGGGASTGAGLHSAAKVIVADIP
ncbi:MAG: hypothetical protein WKF77_18990, partial [Planctomycetaceae bacterium]